MPHITKGGKYIFSWTIVRPNGEISLPNEAVEEYEIQPNEKVLIISGSKATGGVVVANINRVKNSDISNVFLHNQNLANFQIQEGELLKYKGRLYGWTECSSKVTIRLPQKSLEILGIKKGDNLLVIRGSNLGFLMGIKGPLVAKAQKHPEIPVFR